MSKTLTIGSCTFQYPEEGTKAGWGESATDWAVAVSDLLGTLSGADDISVTSAAIVNCQCTAASVGTGSSSLKFSTVTVRSFVTDYAVNRTDPCCVVTVEAGTMTGVFNGTGWTFSHDFTGCAGMCFQITSCGQVEYFSDTSKGAGTIKFSAKTKTQ